MVSGQAQPGRVPSGDAWSFEEYRRFMSAAWPRSQQRMEPAARVALTTEYLRHLPRYVVARCPYCQQPVTQHIDTHSLNGFGWERRGAGYGWAHQLGGQVPLDAHCSHVRILAEYLNLEGETPDDLFADKVIHSGPEVPALMLVPMSAPGARAVIHCLSVGRFDAPVAPYSAYFVTYFTETAAEYDAATAGWGVHYGRVEDQDVTYELASSAQAGRLGWLDTRNPALPLADTADAPFPYADIQGDRWPEHIITRRGIARPPRSLADRLLGLFDRR